MLSDDFLPSMLNTEQNRTELYLRTHSQATHRWRKRKYKQTDNKQRNRQCYNNKTYTDYVENVVAHLFIIIWTNSESFLSVAKLSEASSSFSFIILGLL